MKSSTCASCAETLWSKKKSTVMISAGMSATATWPAGTSPRYLVVFHVSVTSGS